VRPDRAEALAWEGRWSRPVGVASLGAVALLVIGTFVGSSISHDGQAAVLRSAYAHSADLLLSNILEAVGVGLLAVPLYFLFRATCARSDRIHRQFVGVIVAAPLFLCVAGVLNGVAIRQAADEFATGKATTSLTIAKASENCEEERKDNASGFRKEFGKGAAAVRLCAREEVDEDKAEAAATGLLHNLVTGFGFGGGLGITFALIYTCLYAMRVGLLTRFWGSLGIAFGAVSLLPLIQFMPIWFVYFGLLAAGWLPRGRPPAWAAGEAIPWPTPGEKASAELGGEEADGAGEAEPDAPGAPGEDRRKRKRRV
jgi:hypothetical protein